MTPGHFYSWQGSRLNLRVRLQPRASRNEIIGQHDDALRVRVTAPPVEGAANAALVKLLAHSFGVPASQVTLLSGTKGRNKLVRITSPVLLPAGIRASN